MLGGFRRSTARRLEPGDHERLSFDEGAGIHEAEDEPVEIVDFLKCPDRYSRLGARVLLSVMLYGQSGPARRCSPERWPERRTRHFFSMSASKFVEAIVGVGVTRVRELFKQGKSAAAIVFIDELDAVSHSRSSEVSRLKAAMASASRRSTSS